MGNCSWAEFSKLKIAFISVMILTHSLMVAALAATKWDGFYYDLGYNTVMDASQNLWKTNDNNDHHNGLAYFRISDKVLEWKTIVVILETVGLSLAVICCCVLLVFTVVAKLSGNRKVVIITSFCLIIGCIIAGSLIIYGVVHYRRHFKDNLSVNAALPSSGLPLEKHTLTWAPWLCLCCGGLYIASGFLLLFDVLLIINNGKERVAPSEHSMMV